MLMIDLQRNRGYVAEIYFHEEPLNLEGVKISLEHFIIPFTILGFGQFMGIFVLIFIEKLGSLWTS